MKHFFPIKVIYGFIIVVLSIFVCIFLYLNITEWNKHNSGELPPVDDALEEHRDDSLSADDIRAMNPALEWFFVPKCYVNKNDSTDVIPVEIFEKYSTGIISKPVKPDEKLNVYDYEFRLEKYSIDVFYYEKYNGSFIPNDYILVDEHVVKSNDFSVILSLDEYGELSSTYNSTIAANNQQELFGEGIDFNHITDIASSWQHINDIYQNIVTGDVISEGKYESIFDEVKSNE